MNLKSIKSPNVIFFDWDNTLIDNWDALHLAYNKTLKFMGLKTQRKNETLKNSKYSLRETFPKIFKNDWKIAKEFFYKEFEKSHLKNLKPLPEAEKILKVLKKKGIITGIISNKDGLLLRKEINKLGWTKKKYFKVLVGANEAIKDKPSKYPFLLALKRISMKPNKGIWYVGDNDVDIKFAKKNKCFSVFVENKILNKNNLIIMPDLIIKKLGNLNMYL